MNDKLYIDAQQPIVADRGTL